MRRDVQGLAAAPFDVAVIGAGIHGVCIARDAARRGLRVALVDRGDLGGATSHNSLKLVHGGFRYLQHLDLARLRHSAAEQLAWLRTAPHLVRPLPFLIPTFGHGMRGPEAFRMALLAYAAATFDLTRAVPPETRLPAGRVLSRAEMLATVPGMNADGVTGGVIWHDAQMVDADRLLLECARDAHLHGAVIANHVAAERLVCTHGAVTAVEAVDQVTGERLDIRAAVTINAAGPWAAALLDRSGIARGPLGSFAWNWNLVTRALPFAQAVGVQSGRKSDAVVHEAGRMFFVTPWRGVSVIGTAHEPHAGPPDRAAISEAEIEGFLGEINAAYPPADLRREDVLYAYAGLTPAAGERRGQVKRAHRTQILDHAAEHGLGGLISVEGIKYTTARGTAEQVVDRIAERLGKRLAPCSTGTARIPGGPQAPPETTRPAFEAAVLRAVDEDMAIHLDDVVLRRMPHSALGLADAARIDWAAEAMARAFGWDQARRAIELERAQRALSRQAVSLAASALTANSPNRPTVAATS